MINKGSIDEFIAGFPPETQKILNAVRKTIQTAAPLAEEAIKYGIPTYVQNGNLVHFSGYKNQIGLYPGPKAINYFKDILKEYKTSKGAIQFPITKPIPHHVITEIVRYRVKENMEK